jgi:hypothetical protein
MVNVASEVWCDGKIATTLPAKIFRLHEPMFVRHQMFCERHELPE